MLAEFKRARVLGVDAWSIEDKVYPYIDFYDPNGRDSQSVRFSVFMPADHEARRNLEKQLDAIQFGDELDMVVEISNENKVVGGTNRVLVRSKVVIQHFTTAAAGNGRVKPEVVPAPAVAVA